MYDKYCRILFLNQTHLESRVLPSSSTSRRQTSSDGAVQGVVGSGNIDTKVTSREWY